MVTLQAATFDAHDPTRLARFWAAMLDRDVVDETDAALLPGEDGQLGLRFVSSTTVTTGPHRMHLHLTSAGPDDQRRTVAKALALGGAHLDVGQRPEEGHVVLGDPEGNPLCVIEPDNAYLAGCGILGELACDGTRAVGLFWSEALGWPLVWDRDEETAIQSPGGGTKVAWGGPPLIGKTPPYRQRLDLLAAPGLQEREIDRLLSLGATRLDTGQDRVVVLADPDGNELWIRP